MRTMRITAVVAVAALVLAACGDDDDGDVSTTDDTGSAGGGAYPTGADQLVLQVVNDNATVTPGSQLGNIPQFSLYGDGRVIAVGPTTLEYPGPALPNLQQGELPEDQIATILGAAESAGLLDDATDFGEVGLPGAGTTTITVNANGDEHRTSIVGLDAGDDGLDEAQRAARARVRDFVASLSGDAATAEYEATAVGVFIQAATDPEEGAEQIDWPLGALADAGEPIAEVSDVRCVVFAGDDAQTVLETAADARANAIWRSDGERYSLTFRPLLPNETTCADLEAAGSR